MTGFDWTIGATQPLIVVALLLWLVVLVLLRHQHRDEPTRLDVLRAFVARYPPTQRKVSHAEDR